MDGITDWQRKVAAGIAGATPNLGKVLTQIPAYIRGAAARPCNVCGIPFTPTATEKKRGVARRCAPCRSKAEKVFRAKLRASKPPVTVELLREKFRYDPATGLLQRLSAKGWVPCGSKNKSTGYFHVAVHGKLQAAHRVAWVLTHGEWPDGQIDHINGVRHDNRLVNLRVVDQAGNSQNAVTGPKGTCGFVGVTWHKDTQRWAAQIQANKHKHHLGLFDTPEEAHAAYIAAKRVLHADSPIINRISRVGLVQVLNSDLPANDASTTSQPERA